MTSSARRKYDRALGKVSTIYSRVGTVANKRLPLSLEPLYLQHNLIVCSKMGPYMQYEGDIITEGPSPQKLSDGEDKDSSGGKSSNAVDAPKDEGGELVAQDSQRGSRVSTAICNNKVESVSSEDEGTSEELNQGYKQKNVETGKKKRIEIDLNDNRQVGSPGSQGMGNDDDAHEITDISTFDSRYEKTDSSSSGSTSDDCESSSYSSYESEDISQFSDSDEDSECGDADTFSDEEQESCTSNDSESSFEGSGSFSCDSESRSSRNRGEGGGKDFNKSVHYSRKQGAMNFCLVNNYSFSDENVAKDVKIAVPTADVGGAEETACSEKQNKVALIQSKGCDRDSKEKCPPKHHAIDSKGKSANTVRTEDTKNKSIQVPNEVTHHGHVDDGDQLGSGYDDWYCFQYSCLGFSPNKAIEMEEVLKGRLQQKLKDTPPNAKVEKWNARYEKKELLKEKLARMSPKQARAFKKKLQKAKLIKLKEKEKLAIKKKTDRDLKKKKKLIRDDQSNGKNKKTRPSRSRQKVNKDDLQPDQKQYLSKELQAKQQQYIAKLDLKKRMKKRQAEELSRRKNDEVRKHGKEEIKQRSGRKDNVVNRDKKNRGKPKRRSKKNLF